MWCDPPFRNRVVQKIHGGSSSTMISEWGVTPPLLQQGGSKNTWWFISLYDFRMGCDPPFCNSVVQKIHGCSSPTMISEWGVTPPCRVQQGGSKIHGGSSLSP